MRGVALAVIAFAIGDDGGAPSTSAPTVEPESIPVEAETEDTEVAPPRSPRSVPRPSPATRPSVPVKDGMVLVPAGKFTMGSDDRRALPNERPVRLVSVPSFWIDRTEVTVDAYRACVLAGRCSRPSRSSTACTYDVGDPLLPVSCVSWEMAEGYCVASGKRLPREVEWEVAARGRSSARYPWGGGATSCATAITLLHDRTQQSCGRTGPARVGSRPGGASSFGLLDMSGNVEEWVADWYGVATSDLSPRAGASHVLRGGGWLTMPSQSKTTSRNWGSVREAGPNVGFRCARDA